MCKLVKKYFKTFNPFFFLFFFSVIIYSLGIFKTKSIIWGDSLYYYAYTRSIIIDHDIDFANEAYREDFGFPNKPEISQVTGKVINKFSPGSSILWMPAFLVGHGISSVLEFAGFIIVADGYEFLTQYLVAISTILFSTLGLFFVYKLVLLFFDKKVAFLTTLFLYLTTQMFYYTSVDPLNSHSASFMLSSLFLYLLAVFFDAKVGASANKGAIFGKSFGRGLLKTSIFSWQKMLVLGFLGGLITLVRNQDVVILLPVSVYFLVSQSTELETSVLMEKLNRLVLFWGSVFLVMSIQLFATLGLYGQLGSPYIMGGEQLSWFRPNFMRVLFSFGNGLFTFAPVLVVAVAGLIWYIVWGRKLGGYKGLDRGLKLPNLKIKNEHFYKHFSLIALSAFLLQLYVVASWGREIIGGPYGSRMFISVLPHLVLGLGVVFEKYVPKGAGKKYRKFVWVISVGLGLLFVNNLVQTVVMLVRF